MIPFGGADVLIGFEPGEAARNIAYLKKGGTVIVCTKAVRPVTASLSGSGYDGKDALQYLKNNAGRCCIPDMESICKECGSEKVVNIALVGALAGCGDMGLDIADMERAVSMKVKKNYLEMNLRALKLGAGYADNI